MKIEINQKVTAQSIKLKKYRWAIKMFILALCLSSVFSLISQTILNSLGIITSVITICLFIFISIVFDMIGIAATSCDPKFFEEKIKINTKGANVGLSLAKNSEKVCSFCADVVGDICGILSGAGGASIILSVISIIHNPSLAILVSTLVSSLIAGITIFGKACMKEYAIKNSNKLILFVGKFLEKIFFKKKRKKSWHKVCFMIISSMKERSESTCSPVKLDLI